MLVSFLMRYSLYNITIYTKAGRGRRLRMGKRTPYLMILEGRRELIRCCIAPPFSIKGCVMIPHGFVGTIGIVCHCHIMYEWRQTSFLGMVAHHPNPLSGHETPRNSQTCHSQYPSTLKFVPSNNMNNLDDLYYTTTALIVKQVVDATAMTATQHRISIMLICRF